MPFIILQSSSRNRERERNEAYLRNHFTLRQRVFTRVISRNRNRDTNRLMVYRCRECKFTTCSVMPDYHSDSHRSQSRIREESIDLYKRVVILDKVIRIKYSL